MNGKLFSWGHRFSRDCFLCLGGAMALIAVGGLVGNLPDLITSGNWPASDSRELYSIISFFSVSGIVFLTVAYGLLRRKPWSAYLAAAVSAVALAFIIASWSRDAEGDAMPFLFFGVPLLFTLVWSSVVLVQEAKDQKTIRNKEGQENHIG